MLEFKYLIDNILMSLGRGHYSQKISDTPNGRNCPSPCRYFPYSCDAEYIQKNIKDKIITIAIMFLISRSGILI